jgi:recombination protein RecT
MSNLPNQAVANSPPVKPIDTVRAALEKMKSQFQMVLPKHITAERLFRVAMTAIQQTPKLLDCDRQSLYSAVMRSAQLGLEPDGILGQAYLIPFNGKVQFIAALR